LTSIAPLFSDFKLAAVKGIASTIKVKTAYFFGSSVAAIVIGKSTVPIF
jgi:hypothetical protein